VRGPNLTSTAAWQQRLGPAVPSYTCKIIGIERNLCVLAARHESEAKR